MRKLIHGIDLSTPGGVAALLEYHRSRYGGARMELEGDDPGGDGDQGDKPGGQGGQGDAPKPAPPAAPDDSEREKYNFPEGTRVKDMTVEQQNEYHRYHMKKWERRAKTNVPADYDDLKSAAQKWAEHEQAQKTPAQQEIDAAREEGRKTERVESNQRAAQAILRAGLKSRGKSDDEVGDILTAVNFAAFTTDDDVDDDKIARYVNQIAGPVKGSFPDTGGGHREQHRASGVSAGADMYTQTRKPK